MTEHAVVITGGGPTGLMLAGETALAGVAVVGRRASQVLGEQALAYARDVACAAR
jgi:2-polyprenyl-6-methoxyphenol hydroxylase-like FAD-dependent oxidoreductase